MRFLTRSEAAGWCDEAGVALSSDRHRPAEPAGHSFRCALPTVAQLGWFCRWLVLAPPALASKLIWITETGVWPSSENPALVARFLTALGERRGIDTVPAAEVGPDELDDPAALLMIVLASGWDCHLIGARGVLHIFCSHDEWIEFTSLDDGLIEQCRRELATAEVRLLGPRAA